VIAVWCQVSKLCHDENKLPFH